MSNHERSITRSEEPRKNKIFFKPKKSVLIIFLLLITSGLYRIKPVSSSNTIHVPTDFSTIQAAVDNATVGDTIQVAPDIYYEHVFVNKSLTIIGENPQTTIVDGTANGTIFILEASNIYISGFTIRNAGNYNAISSEREIVTSDYHRISNNIITTSAHGIYLSSSDHNTIFNNTLINNPFGSIYLMNADNNNITANTIVEGAYGIKTALSLNNIIIGNTISQTSYAIYLSSSSTDNTIRNNVLSGTIAGVCSTSDRTTVDHNTITEGAYGIYFYNCKSGSVYYNTLMNNAYGIRLYWSSATTSSHNINNNKIQYTDWAIDLVYADGNTFTGNWIQQNTYGIYMSFSSSNTIYRNNFDHNNMQAYAGTGAGTVWDKKIPGEGSQGNYWSDYTGIDANGDGIGDTPYEINPIGSDDYPLMYTWSEHDISIQSVTLSTNEPQPGAIVNITVTVKNKANISVSETFTVTAKYDLNIIETKTVNNLAQGATQTLTFNWNTTGVALGNYTIRAEASVVSDELNTDNNNYIDGEVYVAPALLSDIRGPEDPPGSGLYPPDGVVDMWDFGFFGLAYGAESGDPDWEDYEIADIRGPEDPEGSGLHPPDGEVDMWDFGYCGLQYGESIYD